MTNSKINKNVVMFPSDLQSKLTKSNEILREALQRYTLSEMFLSFNGGKDCTVLLNLLHDLLGDSIQELKIFYFRSADPFTEIEEFVQSCEIHYKIKINEIQADTSMKDVLTTICDSHKEIKACIMGSRRSDPWCDKLQDFQATDRGWPELMRVNPILDWTCENIWDYLLKANVPYCNLYDRGYTSIGNMRNTKPNPHLENQGRPGTFLPAYRLLDDSLERAGRR